MIFNTSYAKHWEYRIADVLRATMAAPTYFPPHEVYQGTQTNGYFIPGNTSELFIDGGVFANDPELTALWAIRMQWKKPVNYHLLSVGTGCYTSTLSSSTWGGYFGWIFNKGFWVNTLMDATRSFTEIIGSNLAKFNNMRRMK
jgi:patatin-like phospholipase/acyl hydrolase